jgi:hypothetical protein
MSSSAVTCLAPSAELPAPTAAVEPAPHRKKRTRRPRIEAWQIDREAVRSVISPAAYLELESLRSQQMPDDADERVFWPLARHKMVQMAQKRPDAAAKMMKAKIGAVCAMLGIPSEEIDKLQQHVTLPHFIDAALSNVALQEFQQNPRFRKLWTEDKIRANPPMRVEFEHAIVLGCIHDAGDIAKSKNWGKLVALKPLQPDDSLYPCNITYMLKATSKLRMRWEFRDTFKNVLGDKRGLVNDAMRNGKQSFVAELSGADARTLRDRLDISADQFWQIVRHGERFGPNGIATFMRSLEEKTKGYFLPFPEPAPELIQIQPARAA